jgi:hypothetical protein
MTGTARDEWERASLDIKGESVRQNLDNVRAKLVAATVVDDKGKRLFSAGDVKALGLKSGAPLDRLFAVAQRLSRITEADVDELAGNS